MQETQEAQSDALRQAQDEARGRRKQLIGVVVGNKMDKTAVVSVERRMRHPLYRKIIRRTKKYKVHDAQNSANLGDIVRIVETRPMSKEKRWRIAEVLSKGNVADLKPTEVGMSEVAELSLRPAVTEPAAGLAPEPEKSTAETGETAPKPEGSEEAGAP